MASDASLTPEIRTYDPTNPGEYEFIVSTWMRSFWESQRVSNIPHGEYVRYQRRLIDRIIGTGFGDCATPRVACDPADPTVIWGWACGAKDGPDLVLHYAYVKKDFRRQGIFKALVDGLARAVPRVVVLTHLPPPTDHGQGQTWLVARVQREIDAKRILYNPYRAYMRLDDDKEGIEG